MRPARNIGLVLEYEGTNFHGWQVQHRTRTVQGELEAALQRLTGADLRVTGASRTDAGVHARGQFCNFSTLSTIPADRFAAALNAHLPPDIAVLSSREVSPAFHARYDACGKWYTYTFVVRRPRLALERNFAHHIVQGLDAAAMQQGAKLLVGTHDFAAFQAAGSNIKDTVRTIYALDVQQREHGLLTLDVKGTGFLYNMVRIIAGTLLLVGRGKLSAQEVGSILLERNRSFAGPTLPAQGLCLMKVYYPEDTFLDSKDML